MKDLEKKLCEKFAAYSILPKAEKRGFIIAYRLLEEEIDELTKSRDNLKKQNENLLKIGDKDFVSMSELMSKNDELTKSVKYYQDESDHWNKQAVEMGNKVTELTKEVESSKGIRYEAGYIDGKNSCAEEIKALKEELERLRKENESFVLKKVNKYLLAYNLYAGIYSFKWTRNQNKAIKFNYKNAIFFSKHCLARIKYLSPINQ